MAKHFGPQHIANGYAAMGSAMRRPAYKGTTQSHSVKEAIERERIRAARMANASKKK